MEPHELARPAPVHLFPTLMYAVEAASDADTGSAYNYIIRCKICSFWVHSCLPFAVSHFLHSLDTERVIPCDFQLLDSRPVIQSSHQHAVQAHFPNSRGPQHCFCRRHPRPESQRAVSRQACCLWQINLLWRQCSRRNLFILDLHPALRPLRHRFQWIGLEDRGQLRWLRGSHSRRQDNHCYGRLFGTSS